MPVAFKARNGPIVSGFKTPSFQILRLEICASFSRFGSEIVWSREPYSQCHFLAYIWAEEPDLVYKQLVGLWEN